MKCSAPRTPSSNNKSVASKNLTEKLVDQFILQTGGECDPAAYREVMIKFWMVALREAHDTGWERGMHVARN